MPDGFYNINNEYITKETIINELIGYYNDLYEANATKITDFNEGSEIRNLLEVMSVLAYNILEEQNETLKNHFVNTAEGEYLDLIGANPNVNLEREQGSPATGLVKFTYPTPVTSELTINIGTTVSNSANSIDYQTTSEGYILTGETYTYIPVECEYAGTDGNCKIGEIDTCEFAHFSVTNEEPFIDGNDYEEDEEYRQRLLDFIQADNFGSIGYYENIMLNNEYVHDIYQKTSSNWTISYAINTNDITTADVAVNELTTFFSDNKNYVVGHQFSLVKSKLHEVSFTVTVNADCGYDEDTIKDFFNVYFHGGSMSEFPIFFNGLNMGEMISAADLVKVLKENLVDITSAQISNIVNTYGDLTPTSNFDFNVESSDYPECAYSLDNVTVVFE